MQKIGFVMMLTIQKNNSLIVFSKSSFKKVCIVVEDIGIRYDPLSVIAYVDKLFSQRQWLF